MTADAETETTHAVRRLNVPVSGVRKFQRAYEAAVPDLPLREVQELLSRGAPRQEMIDLINGRAPNGFLIYFRNDVHPVMRAAGDSADCIAYLMGNHLAKLLDVLNVEVPAALTAS